MKPTTSVMVVRATLPARAGSIFTVLRKIGSSVPAKAATIRLITMAAAMMAPILGSWNQREAATATTEAHIKLLSTLTIISLLSTHFASAENWPGLRGPNHDGSSGETNLPTKFSKTENVKWVADLPGPSGATPAVWGDHVFVSSADPKTKKLHAMCFDRGSGMV